MNIKIIFTLILLLGIGGAFANRSKFITARYPVLGTSLFLYKVIETDISMETKGSGMGQYSCTSSIVVCTLTTNEIPAHLFPLDPTGFYVNISSVTSIEYGIFCQN